MTLDKTLVKSIIYLKVYFDLIFDVIIIRPGPRIKRSEIPGTHGESVIVVVLRKKELAVNVDILVEPSSTAQV
jgi:hypothetical protein